MESYKFYRYIVVLYTYSRDVPSILLTIAGIIAISASISYKGVF